MIVLEAAVSLVIARLLVMLPFRVLERVLQSGVRRRQSPLWLAAARAAAGANQSGNWRCRTPDSETVHRVGRAIREAASRVPFRSACLEQSIAAKLMLRRRGIPSTLYLGFAGPNASHAWLRSGNDVVTGGDDVARFAVVTSFEDVRDDSARHADRVEAQ